MLGVASAGGVVGGKGGGPPIDGNDGTDVIDAVGAPFFGLLNQLINLNVPQVLRRTFCGY